MGDLIDDFLQGFVNFLDRALGRDGRPGRQPIQICKQRVPENGVNNFLIRSRTH